MMAHFACAADDHLFDGHPRNVAARFLLCIKNDWWITENIRCVAT